MKVTVIYYLDAISSWCYWAEPAWKELKKNTPRPRWNSPGRLPCSTNPVMPKLREQEDWFYRRSGTIVRSPFMLKSSWMTGAKEYLAPNCVAEAAKDLGVTDDRVRLALAEAALCVEKRLANGMSRWRWPPGPEPDAAALLKLARSPEIEKRVRKTTAQFHALQVTQRPTFVLISNIDDRAVFSGLVKADPLAAAIDAMLDDAAAYASHAAHFGAPPAH